MSMRDDNQSENSERIIEAAVEVIARDGIEHARLKDIGAVAGVSIGTIQHYFDTRDNLIDRALYRYTIDSIDYLRQLIDSGGDPWDDIVQVYTAFLGRRDGERKARIWISLVNAGMFNVRHLRMLNTVYEEWHRLFRDMLYRGVATGRFNPTRDIEDIVTIMSGITDAFSIGQMGSVPGYNEKALRVGEAFLEMLKGYLNVED
jgi:AcrR family transcriptional regulator